MRVGFIGLGNLGRAMAGRLISQGVELTVWNRTTEKAAEVQRATASNGKVEIAQSPREIAARTHIVFLNLFDSNAVESVLSGSDGILTGDCTGRAIIDTTTNHFARVLGFHSSVKNAGAIYLEAPVLGSVIPATQGALTMLISGERKTYESVQPTLNILAKTIHYLEQPALATKMKLINNLVLGSFMATIAEAVSLGESVGLSSEQVLDILATGAGNSAVLNAKRQKLTEQDYSPHFSVAAIYKDLKYLSEMLNAMRTKNPIGDPIESLFRLAEEKGLGNEDLSAIKKLF